MLISHKYNFIFIKTIKTAGTSIEIELSKIMGDKDTVTRVFPEEIDHKPRNFIINNFETYNHMSCLELKNIIGEKIFNDYYKFTIEREPVDKCISYFSMIKKSPLFKKKVRFGKVFGSFFKSFKILVKKNENLSWDEFVVSKSFPIDYKKYTDRDGNLMVNKIIKYENLEVEFSNLLKKLNISFRPIKIRAKSGFRSEVKVSDKQKRIIYDAFNISNKYTGYKLELWED